MTSESNIEKLARIYNEEGFTKEQMAEDMLKDDRCSFSLVVKVSLQMDYLK